MSNEQLEMSNERNKPETPEAITPETIPPIVEKPEDLPPEIVPPETIPPEAVPPEVVPPEDGTPKGEPEEGETTETEIQEGEGETQEPNGGETETTKIETPVDEIQDTAILQINELRTEFSTAVNNVEYIEFKVLKSGSMEGLYLYSVMNNAQDIFLYIFPEIDVEKGEYITLHLRTLDKYNCCDELREDLTLSGGYESCPTARDLWVTGNAKLLDKTGIVYIQDVKGKIIDAVVLNEKPSTTWSSNQGKFAEITDRLFNSGMWQTANGQKPTPLDAVNTSEIKSSIYKSVSRYENRENTHSAKDWYIAGYITPGQPNK
jgi:hypothetical protein